MRARSVKWKGRPAFRIPMALTPRDTELLMIDATDQDLRRWHQLDGPMLLALKTELMLVEDAEGHRCTVTRGVLETLPGWHPANALVCIVIELQIEWEQ